MFSILKTMFTMFIKYIKHVVLKHTTYTEQYLLNIDTYLNNIDYILFPYFTTMY